jgi:hypothetical protein
MPTVRSRVPTVNIGRQWIEEGIQGNMRRVLMSEPTKLRQ